MGINDAREQLEVCKDEYGKLERENAELQFKLADAWREGYYTGKRDYAGSITGGVPISTPNPYLEGEA